MNEKQKGGMVDAKKHSVMSVAIQKLPYAAIIVDGWSLYHISLDVTRLRPAVWKKKKNLKKKTFLFQSFFFYFSSRKSRVTSKLNHFVFVIFCAKGDRFAANTARTWKTTVWPCRAGEEALTVDSRYCRPSGASCTWRTKRLDARALS